MKKGKNFSAVNRRQRKTINVFNEELFKSIKAILKLFKK